MLTRFKCIWCSHILWFWQQKSSSGLLHQRCLFIVNRINATTQEQYWAKQARLRYEEEDRL